MTFASTPSKIEAALAAFFLVAACQQGGTPPAEPTEAPATVSAAPAAPATPAQEPTTPVATEAVAAAPVVPVASAVPIASAAPSAAPASTGKTGDAKKPATSTAGATAAAPAALAAPKSAGPAAPPADDACTTKNFHYTQVASACRSGGRKAAKEVMKGAVKKAKAGGADVKCGSCHVDMNGFALKSNAVSDLKPWL